MLLDFSFEKKLNRQGYKTIFGVDEVGRGPLAGAVTATAATFLVSSDKYPKQCFKAHSHSPTTLKHCFGYFSGQQGIGSLGNLRDSKKLSAKKREEWNLFFKEHPSIMFATARVTPKIIDRINIHEATRLASKRAVLKLEEKIGKNADIVILDGKMKLDIEREQQSIIKGDERIASCAVASIIAKVTRDQAMRRYHKKYPEYQFDLHKGYGTKLHIEFLKKYGPCAIHRKSFRPVRRSIGVGGPVSLLLG